MCATDATSSSRRLTPAPSPTTTTRRVPSLGALARHPPGARLPDRARPVGAVAPGPAWGPGARTRARDRRGRRGAARGLHGPARRRAGAAPPPACRGRGAGGPPASSGLPSSPRAARGPSPGARAPARGHPGASAHPARPAHRLPAAGAAPRHRPRRWRSEPGGHLAPPGGPGPARARQGGRQRHTGAPEGRTDRGPGPPPPGLAPSKPSRRAGGQRGGGQRRRRSAARQPQGERGARARLPPTTPHGPGAGPADARARPGRPGPRRPGRAGRPRPAPWRGWRQPAPLAAADHAVRDRRRQAHPALAPARARPPGWAPLLRAGRRRRHARGPRCRVSPHGGRAPRPRAKRGALAGASQAGRGAPHSSAEAETPEVGPCASGVPPLALPARPTRWPGPGTRPAYAITRPCSRPGRVAHAGRQRWGAGLTPGGSPRRRGRRAGRAGRVQVVHAWEPVACCTYWISPAARPYAV